MDELDSETTKGAERLMPLLCVVCGNETPNQFNIKLKQKPICEDCANAIMQQQIIWLINTRIIIN